MSEIFIKTFGCTLNKRDSLDILNNNDYTDDLEKIKHSKFVLINTCGVKEQTQTKIINFLKKIKEKKIPQSKIIVFGCLVDIDKPSLLEVLPSAKYFKVKEKEKLKKYLNLKKKENKDVTKIIIVSNGCLGNCYYCAVKFARGRLKSKDLKIILDEVKIVLEKEAQEIYLTSQDLACYGKDKGVSLIELLEEILKIKKDFKLRLGMSNPQHLKPILKKLIKIYKHKNVYKFLHIPIQSGDNKVLKDMNRFYKIEDVYEIIEKFRKNIKNITIATDVIVGYPTENENNFKNTLKAIKKIKPDIINISRYGVRKNIEASKLKDLHSRVKKERSRELTKLFEKISYENNKKYLNKTLEVLVTEKGKNKSVVCRSEEYKPVVVLKDLKIGSKIKVKITNIDKHYLIGTVF